MATISPGISAARLRIERAGREFEAVRPQPAQRAPDPDPAPPFRLGSPLVPDLPAARRASRAITKPPPEPPVYKVCPPPFAATIEAVQAALSCRNDYVPPVSDSIGPLHKLIHIVARHYNIDRAWMMSEARSYVVCHPRQIMFFLAIELSGYSINRIAKLTDRDHTTLLAACKRVRQRMTEEPDLPGIINSLRNQFREWRDREV